MNWKDFFKHLMTQKKISGDEMNWKDRLIRFGAGDEVTCFICGFSIAVLIAILLH